MKKIFIILAVVPLLSNAQDIKKIEAVKKVSVGFSFSPDYNYRTLKNNDGSSSSDMVIDFRDDVEKGKFGFTTGLNLSIKVSEKVDIQTGLLYSDKGYKTPKRETFFPMPMPSEPTHYTSNVSFNYIEIPFKVNFISGRGKTRFIAGAGLAANFLIKESERITLFYADGKEEKRKQSLTSDYNKFNLLSLISTGIEFKLEKNISLRAEPTFRYGFLKIIDQPVTAHLWNLGLNMSVYYNLQ
jgi:hypothetical protein